MTNLCKDVHIPLSTEIRQGKIIIKLLHLHKIIHPLMKLDSVHDNKLQQLPNLRFRVGYN